MVPFSQFAHAIESRSTPLVLDVISGTPNAADWSDKIKAFNAKNAPEKIVNLFVPATPEGGPTPLSRPGSAIGAANGVTPTNRATATPRAASAAPEAPASIIESLAKSSTIQSLAKSPASRLTSVGGGDAGAKSATPGPNAASSVPTTTSTPGKSSATTTTTTTKEKTASTASLPAAEEEEEGEEWKQKLANDVMVEEAKMEKILAGIRSNLKLRAENAKLRAEKYETGRKNRYWYDWPYYLYPEWRSLPYHPTYHNVFYPWNARPGAFKNLTPFADQEGWTTK